MDIEKTANTGRGQTHHKESKSDINGSSFASDIPHLI